MNEEKKTTCVICKAAGDELVLNGLGMRKCPHCGLLWRETFDVPIEQYVSKEIDLSSRKIRDRIDNCKDRITTAAKYIDMNNVCDIGCGEGLFLKALRDLGYQNAIGVEPNDTVGWFKDEHKLTILKGTVDDVCRLVQGREVRTFTMFHVIEHLPDPVRALSCLRDCMKPGDRLMIETPDVGSYLYAISDYKNPLVYAEHLFYFDRSNLKKLLRSCGFEIVADGKRGFNQKNMSIRSSLERLGVVSYRNSAGPHDRDAGYAPVLREKGRPAPTKNARTLLKRIIGRILSFLVVLLGRTDYQWVIVRKG